jgi:hypothetical protein
MAVGNSSFGQVVRGQLYCDFVAGEHFYVVLSHLACQVRQYLMPIGYLDLERSVALALNDRSVYGNHIFSWNDVTSLV